MQKLIFFYASLFLFTTTLLAQEKASPYDFGKMWTFENPPKEWLKQTYGMEVQDEWFDYVRKSSLKFASWCSASFISPDGLIMTNHHCSRDVVPALQKEGENFDKQGFYAVRLEDERKAEDLFVEQMIQADDITRLVEDKLSTCNPKDDLATMRTKDWEIKEQYAKKKGWEGLRLQTVTFYSGGKYSIYGFKKYTDIRLVWIPELDLGFFGGDPDNFTYPRYNLDITLWRAYDENAKPLNTSENFLKFNKDGAGEGEPVFVVGNPGRTERYRTVSQLEFDRDNRFGYMYKMMKNRNDIMMAKYNSIKNDPSKEYEAQELLNEIANVANSMKAFGGIYGGLKNPDLFGRKVEMENYIRSKADTQAPWEELSTIYTGLKPLGWATQYLNPNGLKGKIYILIAQLFSYKKMVAENAPADKKDILKGQILSDVEALNDPEEINLFKLLLTEIQEDIYPGDPTLSQVLGKKSIDEFVMSLVKNTKFTDKMKAEEFFANEAAMSNDKDVLLTTGDVMMGKLLEANKVFGESQTKRQSLEAKVANQTFKIFGDQLPPDATFTLRISDGVIKGYDYNGTKAPYKTTYFGLYNRYYAFDKTFPWSLPERWQNPSIELLKQPFNTVSTNDIIGGNSGSPLINKNRECVGLIFDGNIESLPGNFIFDEKSNRTVSVHAGGIYAALKYVFKADRIIAELDKPR
ncbi:MAG: S46 family peptidase [Saprospiraceae bacterium]